MKKRNRSNSIGEMLMMPQINIDNSSDFNGSLVKNSLNSSPGPRTIGVKRSNSPINSASIGYLISSSPTINSTGSPSTPVDIRSVPRVRQLSCKKLIYSYTFGSNSNCSNNSCIKSCGSSSPNIFERSRSPSTNCRQNYQISSPNLLKHRRYAHYHHINQNHLNHTHTHNHSHHHHQNQHFELPSPKRKY